MKRRAFAVVSALGALFALLLITTNTATASNVETVTVCFESGWNHSDSKPFDSEILKEQYTDDGLKIAVPGPEGKQSGYVRLAAPVKLVDVNQSDTQLQYQLDSGYPPAYQMTTTDDPADQATWTGNLVYENGKWWATRPQKWSLVPTAAMGQGGATLEEYKAAYPDRLVYQVGFSLGSGASASAGTVKSLTFQGTMWVFKGSCGTPPTSTTTSTTTTVPTTTTTPPTSTTPTTITTRPTTTTQLPDDTQEQVYYDNCAEVIDAGKAPLYDDKPGYRVGLDRDEDGIACEREELDGAALGGSTPQARNTSGLASTGASVGVFTAIGGVLLLGGASAFVLARRRRAAR